MTREDKIVPTLVREHPVAGTVWSEDTEDREEVIRTRLLSTQSGLGLAEAGALARNVYFSSATMTSSLKNMKLQPARTDQPTASQLIHHKLINEKLISKCLLNSFVYSPENRELSCPNNPYLIIMTENDLLPFALFVSSRNLLIVSQVLSCDRGIYVTSFQLNSSLSCANNHNNIPFLKH